MIGETSMWQATVIICYIIVIFINISSGHMQMKYRMF
jgi:hypothetical protein